MQEHLRSTTTDACRTPADSQLAPLEQVTSGERLVAGFLYNALGQISADTLTETERAAPYASFKPYEIAGITYTVSRMRQTDSENEVTHTAYTLIRTDTADSILTVQNTWGDTTFITPSDAGIIPVTPKHTSREQTVTEGARLFNGYVAAHHRKANAPAPETSRKGYKGAGIMGMAVFAGLVTGWFHGSNENDKTQAALDKQVVPYQNIANEKEENREALARRFGTACMDALRKYRDNGASLEPLSNGEMAQELRDAGDDRCGTWNESIEKYAKILEADASVKTAQRDLRSYEKSAAEFRSQPHLINEQTTSGMTKGIFLGGIIGLAALGINLTARMLKEDSKHAPKAPAAAAGSPPDPTPNA